VRLLLGEPGQPLAVRRNHIARRIHGHGKAGVIAIDPGDIQDANFAKTLHCTGIRRVGDALVAVKFNGEVVADFLILAHTGWSLALSDRVYDLLADALLQGDRGMKVPLVVLRPFAGGDENDQLGKFGAIEGLRRR
jgi:hypothetical protein